MMAWLYSALLPDCVTWVQGIAGGHCVDWKWVTTWTSLPW